MRRKLGGCVAVAGVLGLISTALAHEFDHAPPSFSPSAPVSASINAGGENASWDLVTTIPTGNPHTDLDFFTVGGITYASVGTLAAGANAAGQTIIQLMNADGDVDPQYVFGHPSATCPGIATGVTGLQHDAEAAPKGTTLPQFPNPYIDTRDTQIVLDATDATGRCHDQGTLAIADTKQGGLEIVDVTDPTAPTEIGLTSHVGQAHTVNVDPKRPHIAFVSSSDFVNYDEEGVRPNDEVANESNSMDGIEVVDMSSCMNFPEDATREFKISACDPVVYRYRWPTVDFARSSTFRATAACHELEIYPDDRVTCAAIDATLLLDLSNAFDDNGTPNDYSDDKPRGTPLPCARRESSTAADPWRTSAFVEDCVVGEGGQSLRVADWLQMNPPPSLEGVEKLGAIHHMGFESQQEQNANPPFGSASDIFVAHEAELTQSGRYILATDERGGGVLPIGASCTPGADNPLGNGGIHAFPVSKLGTPAPEPTGAATPEVEAYQEEVYAKSSDGERAIFRTPIQTKPQGSLCTSHVFEQIPGQNRIFMAWYSQGTQVVDFTENADGTIDFERAGYFVPENANEWVSHVFKVERNADGSFTYWGATGDFALGDAGRNVIDIYKATLPAPPKPLGALPPGTPTFPKGGACGSASGFANITSKPRARRKRVRFRFTAPNGATATVFRRASGRRIMRRKVKRFTDRERTFTWRPRRVRDGFYEVRFVTKALDGRKDVRHLAVRRRNGRFYNLPPFDRRSSCSLVRYYSLGRSVFGGRKRKPLRVRFNLDEASDVKITVKRRGKVVRRVNAKGSPAGKNVTRIRLGRKAKRGPYRVKLKAQAPGHASEQTLRARYL